MSGKITTIKGRKKDVCPKCRQHAEFTPGKNTGQPCYYLKYWKCSLCGHESMFCERLFYTDAERAERDAKWDGYGKEWYTENKERQNRKRREWHAANRERENRRNREYRKTSPVYAERNKEYQRRYKERHREEILARQRELHLANRDKIALRKKVYRLNKHRREMEAKRAQEPAAEGRVPEV